MPGDGTAVPVSREDRLLRTVRRAAFQLLFASGAPVPVAAVAREAGRDEASVRAVLGPAEDRGVLRLETDGRVVGSGGLSVVPTRHELRVDGKRFWTWCAYDAVGILAAVGRGGSVASTSPLSGRLLEARFDGAVPTDPTLAVFIASMSGCRSIVDEWCPLNNLFEDERSARAWADENGVEGTALGIVETAQLGGERWREWFTPCAAGPDAER